MTDTSQDPLLIDVPQSFDTERLALRCPQRGDGEAVFRAVLETLDDLRKFPASMSWALQQPSIVTSEVFCREAYARFLARTDLPFLAFRRDTGDLVVATGLHRPDWDVPKFEIGFWRRTSADLTALLPKPFAGSWTLPCRACVPCAWRHWWTTRMRPPALFASASG